MRPDDGIRIDAKIGTSLCRLAPGNSVGVKELARRISRIKHGEFGALVTTSYVNGQAYREASSTRGRSAALVEQPAHELVIADFVLSPLVPEGAVQVWVPKTCATWADAL